MKSPITPLTHAQARFWDFYSNKENWRPARPPSLKACKEFLGAKSDNSVYKYLKVFEKKGYLNQLNN